MNIRKSILELSHVVTNSSIGTSYHDLIQGGAEWTSGLFIGVAGAVLYNCIIHKLTDKTNINNLLFFILVFIPVGSILATLFCTIQIFLIFRNIRFAFIISNCPADNYFSLLIDVMHNYSDHLHRSARGDFSFLPQGLPELKVSMV